MNDPPYKRTKMGSSSGLQMPHMSDDELVDWILHVRQCLQTGQHCNNGHCLEMRNLIRHMKACSLGSSCTESMCPRAKFILTHSKTCVQNNCPHWCQTLRCAYTQYKQTKDGNAGASHQFPSLASNISSFNNATQQPSSEYMADTVTVQTPLPGSIADGRSRTSSTLSVAGQQQQQQQLTYKPLCFHWRTGRNVILNTNMTLASRSLDSQRNGYVATWRPLLVGESILLQVVGVMPMGVTGSLTFGVTSCDPSTLKISEWPDDSSELMDRTEYWIVLPNVCVSPAVGDELSFELQPNGEILFSCNKLPSVSLMFVDTNVKLWAFWDMCGAVHSLRLLGTRGVNENAMDLDSTGTMFQTPALASANPAQPPIDSHSGQTGSPGWPSIPLGRTLTITPNNQEHSRHNETHSQPFVYASPAPGPCVNNITCASVASTGISFAPSAMWSLSSATNPFVAAAAVVGGSTFIAPSSGFSSVQTATKVPAFENAAEQNGSNIKRHGSDLYAGFVPSCAGVAFAPPQPVFSNGRVMASSAAALSPLGHLETGKLPTYTNAWSFGTAGNPVLSQQSAMTTNEQLRLPPSSTVDSSSSYVYATLPRASNTTGAVSPQNPLLAMLPAKLSQNSAGNSIQSTVMSASSNAGFVQMPCAGVTSLQYLTSSSNNPWIFNRPLVTSSPNAGLQSRTNVEGGGSASPIISNAYDATRSLNSLARLTSVAVTNSSLSPVNNAQSVVNSVNYSFASSAISSTLSSPSTTLSATTKNVKQSADCGAVAAMCGERDEDECVVCMERPPDCALYSCGHMCLCYTCAQNIKSSSSPLCPICQQPVKDVLKIFRP